MSRFTWSTGILLATSLVIAAPKVRDDSASAYYHAIEVGTTWVFDENGNQRTRKIIRAEERHGKTLVTVGEVTGESIKPLYRVAVSKDGLDDLELTGDGGKPVPILRAPVKKGDKWDFVMPLAEFNLELRGTKEIMGEEDVEVPAGKFRAIRVDVVITTVDAKRLDTVERWTYWYCAGIGEVKSSRGKDHLRVLKAFVRGTK
jgi:hypothetical protein